MIRKKSVSTLVLFAQYDVRASYYDDWLDAFRASDHFDVSELNICRSDAQVQLAVGMRSADLIVLLHSCTADHVFYLEPLAQSLADRRQPLVSFVGNEVNLPGAPITDKRRVLSLISPDFIATQLLQEAGEYLWGDLAQKKVISVPHALNPKAFVPVLADDERPLDLGVRSFRYPPHLGDTDRNRMMDFFSDFGPASGLLVDIGEERLDRTAWAGFLNRCKGTLATEAGSWFLSRDDSAIREISAYCEAQAKRKWVISADNVALRRLAHRLPWWLRQMLANFLRKGPIGYEAIPAALENSEQIISMFFSGRARAPVYGKCISSRHFDAIGAGSVQILMEGRYNDILRPDEHYLALKSDFSNAQEVITRFKDRGERRRIASAAREHVLAAHTYQRRIAELTEILFG